MAAIGYFLLKGPKTAKGGTEIKQTFFKQIVCLLLHWQTHQSYFKRNSLRIAWAQRQGKIICVGVKKVWVLILLWNFLLIPKRQVWWKSDCPFLTNRSWIKEGRPKKGYGFLKDIFTYIAPRHYRASCIFHDEYLSFPHGIRCKTKQIEHYGCCIGNFMTKNKKIYQAENCKFGGRGSVSPEA